jgi:hypothetical protein
MRKLILLLIIGCTLFGCKAQTKIDSVSLESREKADIILESFASVDASETLLYSLSDNSFLVILKNDDNYTEYYTSLDENKINDKRILKTNKSDKKLLADAFKLDQYHRDFITKIPDAKYVRGNKSYFVIKDAKGKRYGEYSLPSLSLPLPINGLLAGYLIRRLSEEMQ